MLTYSIIATVAFFLLLAIFIFKIKQKNNYIQEETKYYNRQIEMNQRLSNKEVEKIKNDFLLEKEDLSNIINQTKQALTNETKHRERLQQKIANTNCLFCGKPSNAKHFCFSCYSKYKTRSIDIRISKCANIEVLDYYGNKTFVCDDGRMVRSRAEALISNFLFNNKIRYIYEKPIYYVDNNENKILHPDFFLPDYNLYIEYNELNEDSYLQSKEYVMKIYQKEKINVVIMTNKELCNISNFLIPKLKTIKQN